jgi:hypothetical protein
MFTEKLFLQVEETKIQTKITKSEEKLVYTFDFLKRNFLKRKNRENYSLKKNYKIAQKLNYSVFKRKKEFYTDWKILVAIHLT